MLKYHFTNEIITNEFYHTCLPVGVFYPTVSCEPWCYCSELSRKEEAIEHGRQGLNLSISDECTGDVNMLRSSHTDMVTLHEVTLMRVDYIHELQPAHHNIAVPLSRSTMHLVSVMTIINELPNPPTPCPACRHNWLNLLDAPVCIGFFCIPFDHK